MKTNMMILTSCILIFFAGVVWSPILIRPGPYSFDYGLLKSVFELLSYAATVVAAFFAVTAVREWKSQFRHNEKFKALTDLNESAVGMMIVGDYIFDMTDSLISNKLGENSNSEAIDHSKWWDVFRAFTTRLESLSFLLSEAELANLAKNASGIESLHIRHVNLFYQNLKNIKVLGVDSLVDHVEVWRDDMLCAVQALRQELSILLKKSVE